MPGIRGAGGLTAHGEPETKQLKLLNPFTRHPCDWVCAACPLSLLNIALMGFKSKLSEETARVGFLTALEHSVCVRVCVRGVQRAAIKVAAVQPDKKVASVLQAESSLSLLAQRAPALENYVSPEQWQSARSSCLTRVRSHPSWSRALKMLHACRSFCDLTG